MLCPLMRKGTQMKWKKVNARRATRNILKRYRLVIAGKKNCLRFDFNDICAPKMKVAGTPCSPWFSP